MRTLFGLVMYLVLVCTWVVFGLSLIISPSLLGLALLVVSFGVIIEWQHILERDEAAQYTNLTAR